MLSKSFDSNRKLKHLTLRFDLVVVGGGLTGVCAAISAARKGLKVVLVQDRPVLGGTGSSEIRVWMLGATSHMGNNNRWAREGGIVDEILVENTYRNKEGNPMLFDMVLIDKVKAERNISLFLNTMVYDVTMSGERKVASVDAFNSTAETRYTFEGKFFCDATGDGLVSYLAGAAYRMGAEDEDEFDEKFAPDKDIYGEKLGSSLLLYFKDEGKPVKYTAPDFAMKREDIEQNIHRVHNPGYFDPMYNHGCKYWWVEYGGRLDTIYDNEEIKFTLWKVAYGLWDYIKNSGKYPEAETKTLEWIGCIPGKRESRRFVGLYMLNQKDVIEQRTHYDAVTFGGWSIDLHPSDGVFSDKNACNQWHSKGIYQIPYRCYITKDIDNLFFGGRLISASHVAFGSTRVMLTCGVGGEVIGAAASVCLKNNWSTLDLADRDKIGTLQTLLVETGNYIPHIEFNLKNNLINDATVSVSSTLELSEIPFDGEWKSLQYSIAQMLPLEKGTCPELVVRVRAKEKTLLKTELRISSKRFNHTPDVILDTTEHQLEVGEQDVVVKYTGNLPHTCYAFISFMSNEMTDIQLSETRITGLLTVYNKVMPDVSNWGKQTPPNNIGIEEFEFWCPERRPNGQNIAMKISPAINVFDVSNLYKAIYRPINKPNAWVANLNDKEAEIRIQWEEEKEINSITLFTDTDYDQPMETVQWGHYDSRIPFCVDCIIVLDDKDNIIAEIKENYRTRIEIELSSSVKTKKIVLKLVNSMPKMLVSLFYINIT